jgi:hypothetical protein
MWPKMTQPAIASDNASHYDVWPVEQRVLVESAQCQQPAFKTQDGEAP